MNNKEKTIEVYIKLYPNLNNDQISILASQHADYNSIIEVYNLDAKKVGV